MGFTVTPLAQKARTATLIADSDLNLGNYDLIATDVRGDTAEFDEFVGGVGNFTNVLGSGNLDIEGTGNIKGLTTFQNAVQVNGSLHVEGSINNVNIADNGEITTAQGVNGADFNGAKITSTKFNGATIDTTGNITGVKGTFSGAVTGASFNQHVFKNNSVYTVTGGTSQSFLLPIHASTTDRANQVLTLLPVDGNNTYTGTINFTSRQGGGVNYHDGLHESIQTLATPENTITTLSFTNIPYLIVAGSVLGVSCYRFTIT